MKASVSQLGFALLGLLHTKASSGYDLRKIFAMTPMSSFSDSPGAIYPALRRLQAAGLIRGLGKTDSRRRQVFQLTPAGNTALKKWLTAPLQREDVVRHIEEVFLRFAFMDQVAGKDTSTQFLKSFVRELEAFIPSLHEYLEAAKSMMPMSGRLALESGIRGYETQLRWAKDALAAYERKM